MPQQQLWGFLIAFLKPVEERTTPPGPLDGKHASIDTVNADPGQADLHDHDRR